MDALSDRLADFARCDVPDGGEPLARWEEGAGLLFEACVADPPVDPAALATHRDALDETRAAAVERGDRPGLVRWARGRVSELDVSLGGIEGETGSANVCLAEEILGEARWLRLLLARTGRGKIDVALQEAEREAATLCEMLGVGVGPSGELVTIGLRLLTHRLSAVESSVDEERDDGNLVMPLAAAEVLAEEASRIAAAWPDREDARERAARAEEVEGNVRRRVEGEIRAASPDRAAELATSLAGVVAETADEARVLTSDLEPEAARHMVARARRGLERVLALWRSLPGEPRRPRALKRLVRLRRRLRAEEQELGLQARLERIFGRRVVSVAENLILFLILGVVGILLYEGLADPSPETIHTLMWIDVGICAVFLTELFIRLALVPGGRGRWFLRHLPFDFLPSIPFGLIVHMMTLNVARAGRIARLVRLERLARYVRVVRPFVRVFRVLAFLLRGLDRLVHRNSRILNRDVLLFTPAPTEHEVRQEAEASVPAGLERVSFDVLRQEIEEVPAGEREEALRARLRRTVRFVERATEAVERCASGVVGGRTRSPAIRIEDMIHDLRRATPSSVERLLGVETTARLAQKLRWLDLPLLRQLPFVRRFAPGARGMGSGEVTARAARTLGRAVQRSYDRILTVADLTGMISGPQLLDRVGGALSRSAGRPARRLLMLGAAFLILRGLAAVLGLTEKEGIGEWADKLQTYLGTPILILGGICLVAFAMGIWFRRIAGEATDFLERTAEAQYLNLLKIVKFQRLEEDLALIQGRVLEPERILAGGARAEPERIAAEAVRLCEDVRRMLGTGGLDTEVRAWPGVDLPRRQRVLGLVHDYLDGATLHRSDRKTTEQLLGNLALRNLWRRRMRLTRAHVKRLRRLDLGRDRGLGGPYLWFNFITRTVAQRTAELILEYNRHACPLDELGRLTEEERAANEAWIEDRLSGKPGSGESEDRAFQTSFFSALHVLAAGERLEAAVEDRFGPRILEALRCDRRRMIREIFGTYPLHELPVTRRTMNPYELYRRHVAGFRIVLLPLTLVRLYLRGVWVFVRRLGQIVQEVRRPELATQARARGIAGFDVALRKIARMRGPVFRECAWLRSLADVEFLGLGVPGLPGRSACHGFEEDLAVLPMTRDWRERFLDLREERRRDLRALRRLLDEHRVSVEGLAPLMGQDVEDPIAAARILRAVTVGYVADDRHCRSLLTAQERIEEAFDEVLRDPLAAPRRALWRRGVDLIRHGLGLVSERLDPLPAALARYLEVMPRTLRRGERRRLLRAVRSDHRGTRALLRLAGSSEHAGRTRISAWERLVVVARDHERLDEELLTLRTVQTLAVLDVRHYRDLIRRLGEYE